MITLRGGSRGQAVKQLQRLLRLEVTGVFDQAVQNAVRAYQQRASDPRLDADGVVGFKTWKHLIAHRSAEAGRDVRGKVLGVKKSVRLPTVVGGQSASTLDIEAIVTPLLGAVFKNTNRNRKMLVEGIKTLLPYLKELGLGSERAIMHFIAQSREEVGYGITIEENLNYSCKALRSGLFSYYTTCGARKREANADGRCAGRSANQRIIANKVYGGRMRNGAIGNGNGWRYRGRGAHMITGLRNYNAQNIAYDQMGIDYNPVLDPDKLSSPEYWLLSAAIYWRDSNMQTLSDEGLTRAACDKITYKINSKTKSYNSRWKHLQAVSRAYPNAGLAYTGVV